jgi:DnaJ-class molecular chaperone
MRELIEARDVLNEPRKRAQYDRSIGIAPRVIKPVALRPEDV